MTSFSRFTLLPSLQKTLEEQGFVKPTEIQDKAIPALLSGQSVACVSETGSGKTLAYVLPLLHRLKTLELEGDPITAEGRPRAVVMVPTRELGEQVARIFKPFTHTTRLRVRSVIGGTALEVAKKNICGAFEILVATPGRLVKLLDRGLVDFSDVRCLVFDEVDQMLDHGFLPDSNKIVESCPAHRQLALFSATVSPQVQGLMNKLFAGTDVIRSKRSHKTAEGLTTQNLPVPGPSRFPLLHRVLGDKVPGGTIIFTNTREQCDELAAELAKASRQCVVYRGSMDKVERRSNLKSFRDGKIDLLVSTDLASRGLDVEHVGRVINYHLPYQIESYLHRVGRTARAGRKGLVINFVGDRDRAFVKQVETILGV
jgi:ATP-dependent RNA helicase RhlE